MPSKVIVFGPTGNVGSFVARTARQRGATVYLAMRNLAKPIPGLEAEQEARDGFRRIQADLLQPQSVFSAVEATQATSAFIYLAHGTSDNMKGTIKALKAAGINFVVFLSSFTIKGGTQKIKPGDVIPYIHAQVEINLADTYGPEGYVALRAGAFATNTLRWKAGIANSEMKLYNPDTKYDFITPQDMGTAGGTILVDGQTDKNSIVYLYGPRLMAQKDALAIVARALRKRIVVVPAGEELSVEQSSDVKRDERNVIVQLEAEENRGGWVATAYSNFEISAGTVEKYTGRPATGFQEWIENNVARFR